MEGVRVFLSPVSFRVRRLVGLEGRTREFVASLPEYGVVVPADRMVALRRHYRRARRAHHPLSASDARAVAVAWTLAVPFPSSGRQVG